MYCWVRYLKLFLWTLNQLQLSVVPRGVRLAKNDFGLVSQKKLRFSVQFLHCVVHVYAVYWVLSSLLFCHCFVWFTPLQMLEMMYFRAELVQLMTKWLRTSSERYSMTKKYFDCWSYHVGRWIVNETAWKAIPKPLTSVFFKPNCGNLSFQFFNFEVSSVRFFENWYPTFSSGSAHP